MRVITITLLALALAIPPANAQIPPQTMGKSEKMSDPGVNWFISVADDAAYVFDAASGEMQGLISISRNTPVVQPSMERHEIYAAVSYYSRGSYGDRTDLLTVHDFENLSPVAEIDIPDKLAYLGFSTYIGLMSNGKHVGVSNITPAQSVSIVDVENRSLVDEISTPGCALILPVQNNDFMTICGDGTLMLVELDNNGRETNRVRSKKFFDVQKDAVYDRPVPSADGWLLFSHGGKAFNVTVSGSRINVDSPWELVTKEDAEEGWWPGGKQLATLHKDLGLFYIIMHQGEEYSHHEPGTEIWVFSLNSKKRIARIDFETPIENVMVTQEAEPLLILTDEEGETQVYDALKFSHERSIEGPPAGLFVDF
jgi:methylamine dehydrogenase heavy chain